MAKGITTVLITIGLDQEKKLTIVGPLDDKTTCVMILADALKMVAVHQVPKKDPGLLVPRKPEGVIVPGGAA